MYKLKIVIQKQYWRPRWASRSTSSSSLEAHILLPPRPDRQTDRCPKWATALARHRHVRGKVTALLAGFTSLVTSLSRAHFCRKVKTPRSGPPYFLPPARPLFQYRLSTTASSRHVEGVEKREVKRIRCFRREFNLRR